MKPTWGRFDYIESTRLIQIPPNGPVTTVHLEPLNRVANYIRPLDGVAESQQALIKAVVPMLALHRAASSSQSEGGVHHNVRSFLP